HSAALVEIGGFRLRPCGRWRGSSEPGGTGIGSSASSSWCSTFPGSSTFPGVQRYWEGVPGVAWEGRALARPLHRAGARRSQEARRSREFNVTGRVFRGLPGRDEHWLVHFIELVLDVSWRLCRWLPALGDHWLIHFIELVLDVPRKLDVPGSSTLLGGCSGGFLGGTTPGSSTSSSWCSTFPGSSTFPGVQRY